MDTVLKTFLLALSTSIFSASACPAVKGSMVNGLISPIITQFTPICGKSIDIVNNLEKQTGVFKKLSARWYEIYAVPKEQVTLAEKIFEQRLLKNNSRYVITAGFQGGPNNYGSSWYSQTTKKGFWIIRRDNPNSSYSIFMIIGTNESNSSSDGLYADHLFSIISDKRISPVKNSSFAKSNLSQDEQMQTIYADAPGTKGSITPIGNNSYIRVNQVSGAGGSQTVIATIYHFNDPKSREWAGCLFAPGGEGAYSLISKPMQLRGYAGVAEYYIYSSGSTYRILISYGNNVTSIGRVCNTSITLSR